MINKILNRVCSLLVLAAFLAPLCPTRAQERKVDFGELEKVVLAELKETNTPGAAVAVISGDRVIFSKGFGVANTETGGAVTPNMLFRIASTSKIFTAATLLTLAEEGQLKLDAPIGTYAKGLNPKLAAVTAQQLLSHTAGIKDVDAPTGPHDEAMVGAAVRAWGGDFAFTEPGRIFSYSNEGYDLAGFLIAQVSSTSYAQAVRDRLLIPLGMSRSVFRPTMAMTYPLAQGHNASGTEKPKVIRPFIDNAVGWPNGYLFSSADDLARFAIAFMNGGRLGGKQVLSPKVIDAMQTAHAAIPIPVNENGTWKNGVGMVDYGYGLVLRNFRGVRVAEHGGAMEGFGCVFRMAPQQRFAVVVLANKTDAELQRTAEKAMELLLPLTTKPPSVNTSRSLPMGASEMMNYVGTYVNSEAASYTILVRDGRLFIRSDAEMDEDKGVEAPVSKIGAKVFAAMSPDGKETQVFLLLPGSDGQKIEYLHMNLRALKKVSP